MTAAARKAPAETRLAEAALKLLAKKPWRTLALAEVARAAKISLAALHGLAPAKPALIALVLDKLGDDLAEAYEPDRGGATARDRLFDVAMAWFDSAAKHKRAIKSLYEGLRSDPFTLIAARGAFVRAAEWLMTLAEADTGPALALRAAGFAAILARAVPVWLEDDAGLAKTMATLDGDLRRGESLLKGAAARET